MTTGKLLAAAPAVADAAEPHRDDRTPPLAEATARISARASVRRGGARTRQKAASAPPPDAQEQVSHGR